MRWLVPEDRALVLGSTQPWADVDHARAAAAHTAVVRRRSGGGAVLVAPGEVVWADVFVPAGDVLWEADVGRAFWWLGDAWVSALEAVGVTGASPWRGPLQTTAWSRRICFAGTGPGEVLAGGAKVVGMSQRRTRHGALFQCAALIRWDPGPVLDLLALGERQRESALVELAEVGAGLGDEIGGRLRPAFVEELHRRG